MSDEGGDGGASASADAGAPAEVASAPAAIPAPEVTTAAPVDAPMVSEIEIEAAETPQASPPPEPVQHSSSSATPEPSASERPSPSIPQTSIPIKTYLSQALEKIQFRKRAKLDKILALAAKKRSIKNDDVEKLLHVSDATASRYLAQLVREGRLKRSGKTADVIYEPI